MIRQVFLKFILLGFFIQSANLVALCQKIELELNAGWKFRKAESDSVYHAKVPGSVHSDLMRNGLIPDPYKGTNEAMVQWVEEMSWEYFTIFKVPASMLTKEYVELTFEGLDTYASVFLNDSLVLTSDNSFRTWKVDAKSRLKSGKNFLKIKFYPAVKRGRELATSFPQKLPGGERVFTRKAQYQYGWDWGPRLVSCGIWKPLKIAAFDGETPQNPVLRQTSLSDQVANLEYSATFKKAIEKNQLVKILWGDSLLGEKEIKAGSASVSLTIKISNPEKWWCNGSGKPFLYELKAEHSGTENSKPFYSKTFTVGLKHIELKTEPDPSGSSFYFRLNDRAVFMKGANWIPVHVFNLQETENHTKELLILAKNAGVNMLRVWGGGIYESDYFYHLADSLGILIWQDFMFACGMYPGNPEFLETVRMEVSEQIRRIGNHACLALWCGNNEVLEGWNHWGWQKEFEYSIEDSARVFENYKAIFRDLIPSELQKAETQIPWWETSPSLGWGNPTSLKKGDSHYWGVWWGKEPFSNYVSKTGRFMSEYGFQAYPSLHSIKHFSENYHPLLGDSILKSHQKHPTGFETIREYLARDYGKFDSLPEMIYFSQIQQAEGMKTAIESHRRKNPYCMGSLFWQWNDAWPGITWSAIDFEGRPKALYYQIKKSFQPVLLSFETHNDSITIHLINDTETSLRGQLKGKVMDETGKSTFEFSYRVAIQAGNASPVQGFSIPAITKAGGKSDKVYKVDFIWETDSVSALYFFKTPVESILSNPGITLKMLDPGLLELECKSIARNVFLDSDHGKTEFSDNFFNLLPGEKKLVSFTCPRPLEPNISIRSMVDFR